MKVECGDLLSFNGKKYITLEKVMYCNKMYLFANEVFNDDFVSDNYYIFELKDDSIVIINDVDLGKILLPKFQKLLNNDINLLFS